MPLLPETFPGEKALIRLWETIERLGAGLMSPTQIKREGRARAEVRRYELLVDAQARKDLEEVKAGRASVDSKGRLLLTRRTPDDSAPEGAPRIEPDLVGLALGHVADDATRKFLNLRKTIVFAEEELEQNPPTGEMPQTDAGRVDDDWLRRWRDGAQAVSDEQMQRLWARALSGESQKPGSYSMRTLSALMVMGKEEAELIAKAATYCLDGICIYASGDFLATRGLNFGRILALEEMGILNGVNPNLTRTIELLPQGEDYAIPIIYLSQKAIVVRKKEKAALTIPVYKLTSIAIELFRLGKFECDVQYLYDCAQDIKKKGFLVSVADWRPMSDGKGMLFNEVHF